MKTKFVVIMLSLFAFISVECMAQTNKAIKTETFGVSGNCGMCKKTIESAVKKDKAVTAAKWDEETKKIKVTYDSEKTTIEKIHQLIAAAGYDTDKAKGNDEAYKKLSPCCQYERRK